MAESLRTFIEDLIIPDSFDGTSKLKQYYDNPETLSIFSNKINLLKTKPELEVISKDDFFFMIYLQSGIILNEKVYSHVF